MKIYSKFQWKGALIATVLLISAAFVNKANAQTPGPICSGNYFIVNNKSLDVTISYEVVVPGCPFPAGIVGSGIVITAGNFIMVPIPSGYNDIYIVVTNVAGDMATPNKSVHGIPLCYGPNLSQGGTTVSSGYVWNIAWNCTNAQIN